ncbi:efflux RND transporter periplasmic adaptor subunit [Halomonas tibetensis]|uniref:Efflux RND transporter periplasmic adaptor subunit n=1 Tax=Halomonas tibetensis TaxID=2259590 RepID=A0ABV7B531_9GAMM
MTAPVERGTVRRTVTTTGTLQALVTVEVGTQLSGQIAGLFADFNDEVMKGQPLVQLDTKSFEARLAEAVAASAMAQANVDIHQARLQRANVDLRDAEAQRAVLQARHDNARVRLGAAQTALKRAETLVQRGTTSAVQLEEAQTERDQAAASLRETEAIAAAHEHAVEGARVDLQRAEAELTNARAAVPQKKAIERSTEIDLERTTIRSPIDGVVVGRNVSDGQTVAASLEAPTLFTIAGDLQQMEIHARVDEADIGSIEVGQPAGFSVDAYPGEAFEAAVTGVRKAPQVMQNVVTYTVVLATGNVRSLLLPGMTATVRITVEEASPVLKMPMAALRFVPSEDLVKASAPQNTSDEPVQGVPATVWRLGPEGSLEPLTIGIGVNDGAHAAILAGGFAEGDEVIVGEVIDTEPAGLFGIRFGF